MSSKPSAPESACSVCGEPMARDADRCERCGATRGEAHKCPFCRAVAAPVPHARFRFACPVCGAPRIPAPQKKWAPPASAVEQLDQARRLESSKNVWRLSAALIGPFAVLALLVLAGTAAIASPPATAIAAGMVLALLPLAFAAWGLVQAKRRQEQAQQAIERAWVETARKYVADTGSARAVDLAEAFTVSEPDAEKLLVQLSSRHDVGTKVTDQGELAVTAEPVERARLEEPAHRARVADEPATEELEEQPAQPTARGKADE